MYQGMEQVRYWRFQSSLRTHVVRVKNVGQLDQELQLDGNVIEAPPETFALTGPEGSLLELRMVRRSDATVDWGLLVNGVEAESYNPFSPTAEPSRSVHWWKFLFGGHGHHVRVKNIGTAGQEVYLDGAMLEAPEGTTQFTGPAASLLEFRYDGDDWTLRLDGHIVPQFKENEADHSPAACSDGMAGVSAVSWNFIIPSTGSAHTLQVSNMGRAGQRVHLDGVELRGPDGQTTFTGPGGSLLEVKLVQGMWALFIDGRAAEAARSSSVVDNVIAQACVRTAVTPQDILPQGVSLDSESGLYKANIRIAGKFKCLGEFPTIDEAHAKYLQAKAQMG